MTAHNHSAFVEGCYRCELSRDEVVDSGSSQLDLDAIEHWSWSLKSKHQLTVRALVALVRRLQQEKKELRAEVDEQADVVMTIGISNAHDEILTLREALRNIRRVLADDGDGAGAGAMFSMIERHLKAAGF